MTYCVAAFSDAPSPEAQARWAEVESWLGVLGETGAAAPAASHLWDDTYWWLVLDPTGGSHTKETLPPFAEALPGMASNRAGQRAWWSMSDNSMVLNALIDRDQCRLLHGHPLTLAGREAQAQRRRFVLWSQAIKLGLPFPTDVLPHLVPLVGTWDHLATFIGGNLTALERLGDTPWRPRPRGRILLVESLSCPAAHATQRVAALVDDPWWSDIGGLALGRFTHADRDHPEWIEGLISLLPPDLPVCRLPQVGHGSDAWTIPLAEPLALPR